MQRRLFNLACWIALAAFQSTAVAQQYPSKPITMLCWTEAGSAVDAYARAMANLMARDLGQNVVVENRPGADGAVMISHMLKAPADGYTIASITMSLALLVGQPTSTFKIDDLQLLARTQIDAYGVVVPAASLFKTIDDFVAHARRNPGKLNIGGPFDMGAHRVAWEVFSDASKAKVAWIPYKGGAGVVNAVAGAHLDGGVTNPGNIKGLVSGGKLRVLAVSSDRRLPDFPDVPTYKERGWDVVRYQWRGMMAKAGTPQPIVERLVKAIDTARQTPEWKAYLARVMTFDGFQGPEAFKRQLIADVQEVESTKKKLGME
ncbi:MAG TPA: tripartite tricarboxylate transporter substrate binding protein [Burkholderiales bacterium]|nr:tripartite tricarboxylate transporter substrate binding protein [Burkholderiales bacterium]